MLNFEFYQEILRFSPQKSDQSILMKIYENWPWLTGIITFQVHVNSCIIHVMIKEMCLYKYRSSFFWCWNCCKKCVNKYPKKTYE